LHIRFRKGERKGSPLAAPTEDRAWGLSKSGRGRQPGKGRVDGETKGKGKEPKPGGKAPNQ